MPTKTEGKEAPGDANAYAGGFTAQKLDIFGGTGTRGEDVDLDEDALEKQAAADEQNAKKAKKKKKKKGFGF